MAQNDGSARPLKGTQPVQGLLCRIGIDRVDYYSSPEGIPLFKGHEYELISRYNNTSKADADSMLSIADSDLELLLRVRSALSDVESSVRAVYAVGNGFGFSTAALAAIFPDAQIDVLDLEATACQRACNDLTRSRHANVQLTVGRSPRDAELAQRSVEYQLAFLDGDHAAASVAAELL